jgi:hypothetical protein
VLFSCKQALQVISKMLAAVPTMISLTCVHGALFEELPLSPLAPSLPCLLQLQLPGLGPQGVGP